VTGDRGATDLVHLDRPQPQLARHGTARLRVQVVEVGERVASHSPDAPDTLPGTFAPTPPGGFNRLAGHLERVAGGLDRGTDRRPECRRHGLGNASQRRSIGGGVPGRLAFGVSMGHGRRRAYHRRRRRPAERTDGPAGR
jgi:hypothetical protein